ncbi:TPA: hypothetical protein ACYZE8_000703 [Salmonella enterica]
MMYTELTMQQISVGSIPMGIDVGYNHPYHGKINFQDGRFGLYTVVTLIGNNDKPLINYEGGAVSCCALTFSEVPCDAKGNILLDHYEFEEVYQNMTPEEIVDTVQVMLVCSKEPTHRVNLRTGDVYDNIKDGIYIDNMVLSYIIGQ